MWLNMPFSSVSLILSFTMIGIWNVSNPGEKRKFSRRLDAIQRVDISGHNVLKIDTSIKGLISRQR
jgi:hypothetical protein